MEQYDLLVIGGGINGLGIAADASSRGLSVCIVEKGDWGGGTTSASSRLIHGGLRYLQYGEIDLVRESLHERGILVRQRPHLVHPIQLLIPAYRDAPLPKWVVGIGLRMYDLLAHDPLFPHPASLSVSATQDREPAINPDGLTGGFVYPDAQLEFPERLCVELAQEAAAAGATVRSHTRVTELLRREVAGNSRITGAIVKDELTGATEEIHAALTINAAGPWVDAVNQTLGISAPPRLIGGTWGTHLILPTREAGPAGPIYATAKKDGRPFFLLPWDERLLVGTTDVKFTGDNPDGLVVEPWEIEYLLSETGYLFPDAGYRASDIETTTIGVRPLPASGKSAGAVTRRHFLVDHAAKHQVLGLASVVGGKLTTYRSLAEEATDWAIATLGRTPVACSTGVLPEQSDAPEELARELERALPALGIPVTLAPRLIALYGYAAADVLARVKADRSLARPLGPDTIEIEAQVVHAVEAEFARTVDDIVRRRLMLLPPTDETLGTVRRIVRERHLAVAES